MVHIIYCPLTLPLQSLLKCLIMFVQKAVGKRETRAKGALPAELKRQDSQTTKV
jgi:hypothetical protein